MINRLVNKYRYAGISRKDIMEIIDSNKTTLVSEELLVDEIEKKINISLSDSDCKFQIVSQYFATHSVQANSLDEKKDCIIRFLEKYHIWFTDDEALIFVLDIPFLNAFFATYFDNKNENMLPCRIPPFNQLANAYKKINFPILPENIPNERKYDIEDSISIYFRDMGNITRLTNEEEEYLGYRLLAKDKKAFDIMTVKNLPLVISCIKKLNVPRSYYTELIQVGNMALMDAVNRFDVRKGYCFSTYAVNYINYFFKNYFLTHKYPTKIYYQNEKVINEIKNAQLEFQDNFGYIPSCSEISEYMNLPYEKVFSHLSLMRSSLYMDDEGYDCLDENVLFDYSELDKIEFNEENFDILCDLLDFSEHYKGIIKEYLIMKSMTFVADNVGLSRTRVGQILKNIQRNILKFQELLLMGAIDISNYSESQLRVVEYLKTFKYNEKEADLKKIRTK